MPAKNVAELRQEIAFLNSIIENIPHMIFLKDAKELRFVRFNKAGQKLLGYSQKELIGKNDYDFFPQGEADFFIKKDREVLKNRGVLDIQEEQVRTRKKGIRILHTKKSALYDLAGEPAYLLGISEDITEKKEARAKLTSHEKQLQLALTVAKIGAWSWHVPKDVLLWDENMFRIFGVTPTPGGIVKYSVFEKCLHPRERDRVNHAVQTALKKSPDYNDTFRILHPEKGEREIAVRCAIDRDKDGNAISMTGANLDITEQQHKHAIEVKSKMISMVSHELRTPIHTIKESINVILEGLTGTINDEQKDVLENAELCIDRLTRLINNVLDFQKMDAGMMDLCFEKQNLNDIVQGVAEIEKSTAEKKGLNFEFDFCEDLLIVNADSDKIIQVLTNLVNNAIKFTEKGTITIRTRNMDGNAHVSVIDTGMGFSSDETEKIFLEFGQTTITKKLFPQGTGLGLAISRKIIEQHQGKIWAKSKKPVGSAFYFTLPLDQKNA